MKAICRVFPLVSVLAVLIMSGCGGSSRQLLSLSISPENAIAQNGQISFVATAQYSSAPTPVTPAAVAWWDSSRGFDPAGDTVTMPVTQQPLTVQCFKSLQTFTITAFAPVDANTSGDASLPLSVFMDLVINHKTAHEGGFLATTAQVTCP